MSNVEEHYSVVGVLEDLNTTMQVLQNHIPYYFKGSQQIYLGSLDYCTGTKTLEIIV